MKKQVTDQLFKASVSQLASGICVVTSFDQQDPVGMTATAVCSLSLNPPLMLACFDNDSRTLQAVQAHKRFGLNILNTEQQTLAELFASKELKSELFTDTAYETVDEVPVLKGSLAWLCCELEQLIPGGDHTVGIGRVTATDFDPNAEPLLWFRGQHLP